MLLWAVEKWRKLTKDVVYNSREGRVGVAECSFWHRLTRVVLDKEPLNGLSLSL